MSAAILDSLVNLHLHRPKREWCLDMNDSSSYDWLPATVFSNVPVAFFILKMAT